LRSSIRFKIILLTVLPIAVIYLLIFGFGVYQIHLHSIKDVEEVMRRVTQQYAGVFSGYLRESAQIARSTAAIIEQNPNIPDHQLFAQVKSNLRHNRIVYGSAIAFERDPAYDNELFAPYAYRMGRRIQTLDIADITDYTSGHWQWWDQAKLSRHPIWTDPYFDKGVGNIIMATYAVPFFYQRKFRGVATVDVQLEILEQNVDQRVDTEMDIIIITRKGDYIYHPDPAQIMTNSIYKDAEKYHRPLIKELADKMTSGQRGVMKLNGWDTDTRQWVAFHPIASTQWSIAVRVPEDVVLARVRHEGIRIAVVLLVSLLLILVTVWLVIGKITQPLARLTAGVKSVAEGNLDAVVEVNSNDEIGLLAESFTDMAARLNKREQDIRKARSEGFSRMVQGLKGRYFYFTHDKSGQISYVSPSVEKILGYTADEFQNFFREYVTDNPINKQAAELIERTFRGEQQEAFEMEIRNRTGEALRFEVIVVPVKDEKGRIIALEGMAHDITERKREEEKFRVLFESSSQANLLCSDDGIQDCNHAFLALFGIRDKNEVLGSYLYSLAQPIQPDGRAAYDIINELMEQAGQSGYQQYELVFERMDGEAFPAEIILTAAVMNDEPVFIAILQDLTERKLTEQAIIDAKEAAEEASKTKSEFLSNMSHELRTPLNGVLGYAQILQNDRQVTAEQMESLDAIKSCGHHLLTLINDVLDLSKIESGKMEFNISPVDLRELIKGVYDMVSPRVAARGLELVLELQDSLPRGIKTDATKLRQVLINLLGNAVKFTHKGSITLKVFEQMDFQSDSSLERRIHFVVEDTGIGIPNDKQQSVFDAFQQAKEGIDAGGTGLGLAISQRLVREMGGTSISLQSEYGKGSAFAFSLPLIEVSDAELTVPALENDDDTSIPHLPDNVQMNALIVDDRETNRDILKRILQAAGFKVIIAVNGQQAVELTLKHRIALVLMDIRMPEMDGITATRTIREQIGRQAQPWNVVIIAVTASVFPDASETLQEVQMDDFIAKPFKIAQVFRKIEQHTGLKFIWETRKGSAEQTTGNSVIAIEQHLEQKDLLTLLQQLLESSEVGDIRQIQSVYNSLQHVAEIPAHLKQQLSGKIKDFDFTGIAHITEAIIAELKETDQ